MPLPPPAPLQGPSDDPPPRGCQLHTNLQKAGSGVEEAGKEHIRGAVEECLEDARSIDQNTSALNVSFSGDRDNPIKLRDDELCASEDEIDWENVNGDQEILGRAEIVLNPSRTPTSDPDQGVGHSGNIEDLTIKPLKQHSFLVTGFSRLTPSCQSQSGKSIINACSIPLGARWSQLDEGSGASAFPYQRRETSTYIVDSGYGDSSSKGELGRSDTRKYSQCDDGDAYSSEDNVGRLDNVKYSEWSSLEKHRLLAYKKEGKSWKWIFSKFPGRTEAAVRTRWSKVRPRPKAK
ncbi:hypothetical protein VE03_10422 [Pseudogymnoascus sp. 23342-1-I1]|nr:hypothetical protein VE03_10422 [Pseudogymnoascus sp. 23342-1-I1]